MSGYIHENVAIRIINNPFFVMKFSNKIRKTELCKTRTATFTGHWVSNKHTDVPAIQHVDNNDLLIYAVHDDRWTKMVGLTKSGERVDGRYVEDNVTLDQTCVSKAWDSPSGTNVGKAYYTVDCS